MSNKAKVDVIKNDNYYRGHNFPDPKRVLVKVLDGLDALYSEYCEKSPSTP